MNEPENVLIVGSGLAGAKTAEALRGMGFGGDITVVGTESRLPYERPPLSKGYLSGASSFEDALVNSGDWYSANEVELRLGTRVDLIDRAAHQARLADGFRVRYGKLVIATGSLVRHLPVPGGEAAGVHYLRTVEDADAIRAELGPGKKLTIIGAGWIGLEVAAAARAAGTAVTVVEAAELPLLSVLGPEMAEVFATLHRDNGVELRFSSRVREIMLNDGRVTGVDLRDGERVKTDAVVIGVGVVPDVALARLAGLEVEDGVLVDASLRTNDGDIYAVGDVANHDHPVLRRRVRVEHWANALNQPAVAAAALLGGSDQYRELPYFYTDQYDLRMEYVGHVPRGTHAQVVVRGDLDEHEFVAFWLDQKHRMLAAMNVNVGNVIDEVKPVIRSGRFIDPRRLSDPTIAYADL